jgi:hypothetical protein
MGHAAKNHFLSFYPLNNFQNEEAQAPLFWAIKQLKTQTTCTPSLQSSLHKAAHRGRRCVIRIKPINKQTTRTAAAAQRVK